MILKIRLIFTALLVAGATVAPSPAQEVTADPRAMSSCQEAGGTFVQINSCLPDMHVAYVGLDAFQELYPPDAQPLRIRCAELNKAATGAFICVENAIESAIDLAKVMPKGSSLGDPVFDALTDSNLLSALEERTDQARALFPDKMVWGGGTYFPYK